MASNDPQASYFASVIEALPDATVVFDGSGRLVYANTKYQELLFSEDVGAPEVGEGVLRVARRIVESGRVLGIDQMDPDHAALMLLIEPYCFVKEFEAPMKDGRVLQISSSPLGLDGFLMSLRDIGRDHLGEWRAAELLSRGFDTAGTGMLMWSSGLTVEIANEAWQHLVSPAKFGDHVSEFVADLCDTGVLPLLPHETTEAFVHRALAHANHRSLQVTLHHTDGRFVHISTFPVGAGRIIATAINITEQRNAQERARAMLSDAVESLEVGVLLFDADLNLRMMNQVAGHQLNMRPEQWETGAHLSAVVMDMLQTGTLAPADPSAAIAEFVTFASSFTSGYRPTLAGQKVYEFSSAPTQMGGVLISIRDLTEILSLQEELDRQKATAAQNEKLSALGELLAGVAHELSNPLSVVVGYAAMVQDAVKGTPSEERVHRIVTAADRCVRIVRMFLALARERPAVAKTCDIAELLQTAISVSEGEAQAAGGRVCVNLQPDLPTVVADPDHLTQVFSNLLVNAGYAIRQLGADGRVDVVAFADGEEIVVTVTDNGPGIPEDLRSRIFDPFFTTKDVSEGTGFGLSFCHRVVNAHSGALTLDTSVTCGARFTVRLPAKASRHMPTETAERPGQAAHNRDILIVDDDENILAVLSDALSEAGYLVRTSSDARTAMDLCAETEFDVILTDIRMPSMDGRAFFQALQRDNAHRAKRVIFLTGDTLSPEIIRFIDETGQPVLEKPITPAELMKMIERLPDPVSGVRYG